VSVSEAQRDGQCFGNSVRAMCLLYLRFNWCTAGLLLVVLIFTIHKIKVKSRVRSRYSLCPLLFTSVGQDSSSSSCQNAEKGKFSVVLNSNSSRWPAAAD
jgi:hypothetical protein